MLAKEIMSKSVVTIKDSLTVREARQTMYEKRIRHLPVVNDEDHVVGVFTEHDIFQALDDTTADDHHILSQKVSTYMTTDIISAHPDEFVEDLATIFYDYRIGMLPILEKKKLVGIITRSDLLYTLIQLTGAHQPSSIIQVEVENHSGKLAELATIISHRYTNITSVLVYPSEVDDKKVLLFRVPTMNPYPIVEDILNNGYHVLWPTIEGTLHHD